MCWSGCDWAAICRAASRLIRETTADADRILPSNGAGAGSRNRGRLQRAGDLRPSRQAPRRDRDSAASSVGRSISGAPHRRKIGKVPGFHSSASSRPFFDSRPAASTELFTLLILALLLVRTISTNYGASRLRKKDNHGVAG